AAAGARRGESARRSAGSRACLPACGATGTELVWSTFTWMVKSFTWIPAAFFTLM
ncbi:hypothetical protein Nmel_004228, partial [Mimus melanotis]